MPAMVTCFSAMSALIGAGHGVARVVEEAGGVHERVVREEDADRLLLPGQLLAPPDLRDDRQRRLDHRPAHRRHRRRTCRTGPPGRRWRPSGGSGRRAMQPSMPASTRSRGPKSSIAPHLTSASMTRLLTVRRSTRPQKSSSDLNGPFFSRSATTASTAPSPTFLTAASPKRMPRSNASAVRIVLDPLDGEADLAAVDVRHQDRDAEPPALAERRDDLLGLRDVGGQDGGHPLDRVVRLQVRRLVRDEGVAERRAPC